MDTATAILTSATLLLVVSILVEAVTEIVKNVFPKGVIQDRVTYLTSIVVGVTLAYVLDLNLLGAEGIGKHISIILAGMITSRGANYVNGFMKKFEFLRGSK